MFAIHLYTVEWSNEASIYLVLISRKQLGTIPYMKGFLVEELSSGSFWGLGVLIEL